ncbi:hypothetical protein phiPLPE_09 [Iodobacter phage PhiPLPE]|uniref:Uncharacterized protein n=1 Tax=Iodobacter phage PhiPLPE TaxID=551895 RepID=B5AX28_9CAUD|nr:hypothetical protein phiPLPE_09 [Iodobacter phage PhiPLPE]ACG60331.1 hypothetical protein phiPLPE_09 [Iodobacter phage PhiPLPE]
MFKDIKVGDIVLIETNVSGIGWNTERYRLPYRVEKTTPTRFVAGKGTYTKKDGRLYGGDFGSGSAFIYDERKDQTKEYKALIALKRARSDAINAIDGLTDMLRKGIGIDDLNKIIKFCADLENEKVKK